MWAYGVMGAGIAGWRVVNGVRRGGERVVKIRQAGIIVTNNNRGKMKGVGKQWS